MTDRTCYLLLGAAYLTLAAGIAAFAGIVAHAVPLAGGLFGMSAAGGAYAAFIAFKLAWRD